MSKMIQMFFKHFGDFFRFSRKERIGLLVLILLLLFFICLTLILPLVLPEKRYDVSGWEKEAERYYSPNDSVTAPVKSSFKGVIDPNSAGLEHLLQMGVPSRLASTWVKYLAKGGRFHKKEEVLKLYGMTDELYLKIEGFLFLKDTTEKRETKPLVVKQEIRELKRDPSEDHFPQRDPSEKYKSPLVEINRADSMQLEALPGIGPVLASRIIKYRNLLGGYCKVEQMKELYGMSSELFAKSSPLLFADSTAIRRLEVNFLTVSELGRHPYIGYKAAKKLIRFRDTRGKFSRFEEFEALFSPDSLRRLVPYLSLMVNLP